MIATANKSSEKFRTMAERLESTIAQKRGPRQENTPKRQREAMSQRIEADHLDRVRRALLALADGHESGTLTADLRGIKSKAELEPMLRTEIFSGGYYHVADTGKFRDHSDTAVALRTLMEHRATPEARQAIAAAAERDRLRTLEADLKFTRIPGFFPTPPAVIDRMLELAEIGPEHSVLEPSAGKGDILDRVRELTEDYRYCEISHTLVDVLKAKGYDRPASDDFLECSDAWAADRIVMNPPFEKGQDVAHIRKAYDMLKPGGRLVAVCSAGSFGSRRPTAARFSDWLSEVEGEVHDLPAGSFKNAFKSTGVSVKLVVIDRPDDPRGATVRTADTSTPGNRPGSAREQSGAPEPPPAAPAIRPETAPSPARPLAESQNVSANARPSTPPEPAGSFSEVPTRSNEVFALSNPPAKPRRATFPSLSATRQRQLFSGLDCLPDQKDLFATNGEG